MKSLSSVLGRKKIWIMQKILKNGTLIFPGLPNLFTHAFFFFFATDQSEEEPKKETSKRPQISKSKIIHSFLVTSAPSPQLLISVFHPATCCPKESPTGIGWDLSRIYWKTKEAAHCSNRVPSRCATERDEHQTRSWPAQEAEEASETP